MTGEDASVKVVMLQAHAYGITTLGKMEEVTSW